MFGVSKVWGLLWVVALAGCALEVPQGDPNAESGVDSVEAAVVASPPLVGGWAHGPFVATTSVTLDPVATHVCLLTKVSGASFKDRGSISLLSSTANWQLRVADGARASAFCFRRDEFEGDSEVTTLGERLVALSGQAVKTPGAEAFPFISGLSGRFMLQTPTIAITETASSWLLSASGGVNGEGRAFSVGSGPARRARYFQGNGTVSTTPYRFTLPQTTPPIANPPVSLKVPRYVLMAPVDQAVCGFSELHGGLWSGDQYYAIEPVLTTVGLLWQLSTNSQIAAGRARCYARKQVP